MEGKITGKRSWFRPGLLPGLILLLAAGLYLYKIDWRGLWIDEFISLIDAQKMALNDGRFLYYPLLRLWMLFGNSDAWLRGLAVLFALGSVFLLYQLGRHLFGEAAGLIAALMLAVSPLFINHAQEVRYYTLSTCLTLGGTLALVHALEDPTLGTAKLGWAALRFLAIVTVPFNATLLGPDLLVVGMKFYQRRQSLLAFSQLFLALFLLCIPVAVNLMGTVTSGKHHLVGPIPGAGEVLRQLRIFTAFSYPPSPPYWTRFFHLYILLLVGVLGIALVKKPRSEKLVWVAAWAFLPLAAIFTYSHLFQSIWITRYFLFVCPYIFILLAVGFLKIWQQWRRVAIGAALAYAIALGSGLIHYYTTPERYMGAQGEFYRSVAQTINTEERPGDIIVWSITHKTSMPLEHYHRGSAPIYVKERIPEAEFDRSNLERWLRSLPSIPSRLWLVYPNDSQWFCDVVQEQFKIVRTYRELGRCSVLLIAPKT